MMSDVMLRPPAVVAVTGLSRTTIWRGVRAGTFPAPLELGKNSIGWPTSVIEDWLKGRPRRNYGADAAYRKGHLFPRQKSAAAAPKIRPTRPPHDLHP